MRNFVDLIDLFALLNHQQVIYLASAPNFRPQISEKVQEADAAPN